VPRITYSYPYTDENGSTHDPDTTEDVPDHVAVSLIDAGRARLAEDSTSKKGGK
jgi:hypothetical protein